MFAGFFYIPNICRDLRSDAMRFRLGIEVLLQSRRELLQGMRIGAVVHPASVLSDLRHCADALLEGRGYSLVALFGPQHGARGEKQDNMIESEFYRDPDTGLPVHSLYGEARKPTRDMMAGIDLLLYDLQDVGTRVYTFIWTMACCMEACRQQGKRFVVLDRPNPINGLQVEGGLLDPSFSSFVGLYPIPMRHGMTVGELARFFNVEFNIGCDLVVIPMEGWHRQDWFDESGLFWVPPSPNLPTLDSTIVYPGMVLVEGTALSEGRGTTRPFELIGAPFIRAREYAGHLNALGLQGVKFREAHFQPTFQKWSGSTCAGVQVHVVDRNVFEPYLTGIMTISAAMYLYPDSFAWGLPPYEYEYEKRPIEILCGGRQIPDLIQRSASPDEIRSTWQDAVALFLKKRKPYLIYE
jgi:uncharacterized protein YbbC (DUF1343 family)